MDFRLLAQPVAIDSEGWYAMDSEGWVLRTSSLPLHVNVYVCCCSWILFAINEACNHPPSVRGVFSTSSVETHMLLTCLLKDRWCHQIGVTRVSVNGRGSSLTFFKLLERTLMVVRSRVHQKIRWGQWDSPCSSRHQGYARGVCCDCNAGSWRDGRCLLDGLS